MSNYNQKEFLEAMSESYKKYIEHGARSTEKIKPLHLFVANTLKEIWGDNYQIDYIGTDSKEKKVKGKYYDKDIDITVSKNDKIIMCFGVKFVTSNYKQNSNNYFENMMGETANIQRIDIPYFHLIILRYETPYYEKDGTKKKIEIINEHDLKKYINLSYDIQQAHKPYSIGIELIDINEELLTVNKICTDDIFEKEFINLLKDKLSIDNLFKEVENFKNFYLINSDNQKD